VTQIYIEVDYTPAAGGTTETPSGTRPGLAVYYGTAFPMGKILIYDSSILVREEDVNQPDGAFLIEFSAKQTINLRYDFIFVDKEGRSAPLKSINTDLSRNDIIRENISPPPTISLERAVVGRGESILVSGSAAPGATVEIIVDGQARKPTIASRSGHYLGLINTVLEKLDLGSHQISARQQFPGQSMVSGPSLVKRFVVAQMNARMGDFNADGRVDIADFSIFAAHRNNPQERGRFDLNADGRVDVIDFSIFLKIMVS
jgi:hypothetical protein